MDIVKVDQTIVRLCAPGVAWYSWARQTESMEKLAKYDFEWVLPGHGSLHHDTKQNMRYYLQSCIAWMKTRR